MPSRDIYTVSRLNQDVRALLEGEFPALWVEGEVSNLSRPSSGHLYFSLKDARAQIRCALFQNRAFLFRDCPRNGQHVLVRGRVRSSAPRRADRDDPRNSAESDARANASEAFLDSLYKV